MQKYLQRFGNWISSDQAKMLYDPYNLSREARTALDYAVYTPARELALRTYKAILAKPTPPGQKPLVAFTAGGPGSGKSTFIESPEGLRLRQQVDALYDSNLADTRFAEQLIDLALQRGRRVAIFYVHRTLEEAVHGAIDRALGKEGRAVRLDNLAEGHFNARKTLLHLVERYGNRLRVQVLRSTPGLSTFDLASLDELRRPGYGTMREMNQRVREIYFEEYERRRNTAEAIPEHIHRAFLGGLGE
jgi:hypothetical protein